MISKEFVEYANKVEGWLTNNEAMLLFKLSLSCKGDGEIVEIGSWKGKSTIWLAKGSQLGNKVFVNAVDPFIGDDKCGVEDTFLQFNKNINYDYLQTLINPIVKTSEEAAKDFDNPIGLIFIDGYHSYEAVRKDFENWFPKIVNNGWIAFHDTSGQRGPDKLMREEIFFSNELRNIGFKDSILYAEKCLHNTFFERFRNKIVYFRWEILQILRKIRGWFIKPVYEQ